MMQQHKRSPVPKPTIRHPDQKKEADRLVCRRGFPLWETQEQIDDDVLSKHKAFRSACRNIKAGCRNIKKELNALNGRFVFFTDGIGFATTAQIQEYLDTVTIKQAIAGSRATVPWEQVEKELEL